MLKTNKNSDSLPENFDLGLSGIFKIAILKKSSLPNWMNISPIFISLIIFLSTYILKINTLALALELIDKMIQLLPQILGYTVAGYALMVGFIQPKMLNDITEPQGDSKYSLYQEMSATFALNILIQAISLIIAYFGHYINYFDSNKFLHFALPMNVINIINYSAIIILSYCFSLSLLMLIQIIVNIFGFSQLNHYFINKEKKNNNHENE